MWIMNALNERTNRSCYTKSRIIISVHKIYHTFIIEHVLKAFQENSMYIKLGFINVISKNAVLYSPSPIVRPKGEKRQKRVQS